eukprot:54741_1
MLSSVGSHAHVQTPISPPISGQTTTVMLRTVMKLSHYTYFCNIIALFILQYTFINVKTENVMQKLSSNDGYWDDGFGSYVSMDDQTVIIGARFSAYAFEQIHGNWTLVGKLPWPEPEDLWIRSLCIYNQTVLIGARASPASMFTKNASNQWVKEAELLPNDTLSDDFGFSVSLYNEYALIGDRRDNSSGYIFEKINGHWSQVIQLQPKNISLGTNTQSVSIHKNYALIGMNWAAYENYVDYGNGSAYIFERINDSWTEVAKLLGTSVSIENDRFGNSVSIQNEYALVGAMWSDDNGHQSGSVYVFYCDNGSWTEVAKLLPDDGAEDDRFGESVSIYDKHAVIGARFDDDKGESSGSVYIFERRSPSYWIQTAKLVTNEEIGHDIYGKDIPANNAFGSSVTLYKDNVVIGAPTLLYAANRLGSAYIIRNSFTLSPSGAPTQAPTVPPTNAPTIAPSSTPSSAPSMPPSLAPTKSPTPFSTQPPSATPTIAPSQPPTTSPTNVPTSVPTTPPSLAPSIPPSLAPTESPTYSPTIAPSNAPIVSPTESPTRDPTPSPIDCPFNTFQYSAMTGGGVGCFDCQEDDDGYECKGRSTVNVAYGYWISARIETQKNAKLAALPLINNNNYSIKSLRCPGGQCCANPAGCDYFNSHANVSQINQMICAKHRNISSLTCSQCNDGYYDLLGTSACGRCIDTDYMKIALVFIMAFIFTVLLLFCLSRPTQVLSNITGGNQEIHWRKLIWYDQRTLVTVLVFKIYLYYYQGLSQLLATKNITPSYQFSETLLTLFNFDLSILSVTNEGICFIAGIESGIYELLVSYTWYMFISIHVIIIAFVYLMSMKLLPRANTSSFKPHIKAGCIYIMLMVVGPLLSTSFKFLTCIELDDKYYHLYDAYMMCHGYIWWIAGVLPIVAVCGALIMLWFSMYKQDPPERDNQNNVYWSLTKRFKNNMWFYEFILFIRRFAIAASTSFYDVENQMTSIVLASFITILFALQIKLNPFRHQTANVIESMCLFGTASMIITLIVFDDNSSGISMYLTFLILAPLVVIAVIILSIVYKCYKYRDPKKHYSYTNLKQRWLNKDIELQLHNSNPLNAQQQIERANNMQELMPFIEKKFLLENMKKLLLEDAHDAKDDTVTVDGNICGSAAAAKAMDDMVYFRDNDRRNSVTGVSMTLADETSTPLDE